MREGLCDIGVAAAPEEDRTLLTGLHYQPWRADPLVAVLPLGHRLAAQVAVTLQDLLHENWIGLPRGNLRCSTLQKQALQLNGQLLRTQAQLPHFEGLCQLVGQRVGIAVLPLAAVRRHAGSTGVVAVPLADGWAQRQLLLCTAATAEPPLPVRQLHAHLCAVVGVAVFSVKRYCSNTTRASLLLELSHHGHHQSVIVLDG